MKSLIRKSTTLLLSGLTISFLFNVAGTLAAQVSAQETRISGLQAQALLSAFEEFRERDLDIKNYSVILESKDDGVEVIFVPMHEPGVLPGKGGRTHHGPEIHYLVDFHGDIVRVSYARWIVSSAICSKKLEREAIMMAFRHTTKLATQRATDACQ